MIAGLLRMTIAASAIAAGMTAALVQAQVPAPRRALPTVNGTSLGSRIIAQPSGQRGEVARRLQNRLDTRLKLRREDRIEAGGRSQPAGSQPFVRAIEALRTNPGG